MVGRRRGAGAEDLNRDRAEVARGVGHVVGDVRTVPLGVGLDEHDPVRDRPGGPAGGRDTPALVHGDHPGETGRGAGERERAGVGARGAAGDLGDESVAVRRPGPWPTRARPRAGRGRPGPRRTTARGPHAPAARSPRPRRGGTPRAARPRPRHPPRPPVRGPRRARRRRDDRRAGATRRAGGRGPASRLARTGRPTGRPVTGDGVSGPGADTGEEEAARDPPDRGSTVGASSTAGSTIRRRGSSGGDAHDAPAPVPSARRRSRCSATRRQAASARGSRSGRDTTASGLVRRGPGVRGGVARTRGVVGGRPPPGLGFPVLPLPGPVLAVPVGLSHVRPAPTSASGASAAGRRPRPAPPEGLRRATGSPSSRGRHGGRPSSASPAR